MFATKILLPTPFWYSPPKIEKNNSPPFRVSKQNLFPPCSQGGEGVHTMRGVPSFLPEKKEIKHLGSTDTRPGASKENLYSLYTTKSA